MAMFSLTDPPAALRDGTSPPAPAPAATHSSPAACRRRVPFVITHRPDLGDAIRRLLAETRRRVAAGLERHLPPHRLGRIAAGRPPAPRETDHLAACPECTADVVDLAPGEPGAAGRGG